MRMGRIHGHRIDAGKEREVDRKQSNGQMAFDLSMLLAEVPLAVKAPVEAAHDMIFKARHIDCHLTVNLWSPRRQEPFAFDVFVNAIGDHLRDMVYSALNVET